MNGKAPSDNVRLLALPAGQQHIIEDRHVNSVRQFALQHLDELFHPSLKWPSDLSGHYKIEQLVVWSFYNVMLPVEHAQLELLYEFLKWLLFINDDLNLELMMEDVPITINKKLYGKKPNLDDRIRWLDQSNVQLHISIVMIEDWYQEFFRQRYNKVEVDKLYQSEWNLQFFHIEYVSRRQEDWSIYNVAMQQLKQFDALVKEKCSPGALPSAFHNQPFNWMKSLIMTEKASTAFGNVFDFDDKANRLEKPFDEANGKANDDIKVDKHQEDNVHALVLVSTSSLLPHRYLGHIYVWQPMKSYINHSGQEQLHWFIESKRKLPFKLNEVVSFIGIRTSIINFIFKLERNIALHLLTSVEEYAFLRKIRYAMVERPLGNMPANLEKCGFTILPFGEPNYPYHYKEVRNNEKRSSVLQIVFVSV